MSEPAAASWTTGRDAVVQAEGWGDACDAAVHVAEVVTTELLPPRLSGPTRSLDTAFLPMPRGAEATAAGRLPPPLPPRRAAA